jgi:hypothetical protein
VAQSTSDRWDLTAPESLVLRDGPGADRAQAVKLGLLELVTRGSLRLVDVPGRNWLGRATVEKVLASGSRPLPREGSLAPIAQAFLRAPHRQYPNGTEGRSVKDLARAFATNPKTRGGRYVPDVVMPELGARGLYSRETSRMLGIFPRTRWFLTSEGERRQSQLLQLLTDGERELTSGARDPHQVAMLLATTGAATLLMTSVYPELADVSRRLRQGDPTGDGGTIATTTTFGTDGSTDPAPPDPLPTPTPDASPDPGAVDFDAGAFGSLDMAAFDGIDSAFDAIDSGVDAGSAEGGGDGGDGGGGGD